MRWQVSWQAIVLAVLLFGGGLLIGSYRYREEPIHSTASERLQPAPADPSPSADGTLVYVPVYSSLFLGLSARARSVDLAATVSVRNTSSLHPITLKWVRIQFDRKKGQRLSG